MSEIDSQLWWAIDPGNTFEVQTLLDKGANPNYRGDGGQTAVHRTCLLNCPDQFDLLINAGGSPKAVDDERETPLHLAAFKGHLIMVEKLLALGVDAQQRSDYGSPLDRAAYGGHVSIIAALLNHGVTVTLKNSWGRTPLHEATKYGHLEAARLLLRRGAEVDAVDQFGNDRTPLHEAIFPDQAPLVELLLLYGANFEHRNNWGATPLHMAARIGASDIVDVLLRAGANPDVTDQQGRTPAEEATQRRHTEIITLLKTPLADRSPTPSSPSQLGHRLNSKNKPPQSLSSNSERKIPRWLDLIRSSHKSLHRSGLEKYKEAMQVLRKAIPGKGYMSMEEIKLQDKVLRTVRQDLGFRYNPDGEQRIKRNEEAIRLLNGATGYKSAKEITSEVCVLPLGHLLNLDRILQKQELAQHVLWISPDDEPLLVIFISHRWENGSNPDPYGTQLQLLKRMAEMFLNVAVGLKEPCAKRRERISTLDSHGALQAAYLVGAIASFVDNFQGDEGELRQQLLNRVGIVYDFMCLPQNPRSKEDEVEFLQGMRAFRRLMASTPVLVLRYPDDEYSYRSWCELEYWSAGTLLSQHYRTAAVIRTDLFGKEIGAYELGPPDNYNSYPSFSEALRAIHAWNHDEHITAEAVAGRLMRNYHLAFSLKEKQSKIPLITRPDFNANTQNLIWKGKTLDDPRTVSHIPPSFLFWHSIRQTLCLHGLENEDFAEILKEYMTLHNLACTEARDVVPTALWLLGCHEISADYGFLVFYGRCLLRYLFEGKNLKVSLFFRLPNQQVHFKFFDGEESLEG